MKEFYKTNKDRTSFYRVMNGWTTEVMVNERTARLWHFYNIEFAESIKDTSGEYGGIEITKDEFFAQYNKAAAMLAKLNSPSL